MRELNSKDEAILLEIALCGFLSIKQVQILFYGRNSYSYVCKRLRELTRQGYLYCVKPASETQTYLYSLGKRGISYLNEIGVNYAYPPSNFKRMPSSFHRPHLLTTNDLLISAMKLKGLNENTSGVVVVERRHYLTTTQRNRTVIPDSWVCLEVEGKGAGILFEVDRGSETGEVVKNKVTSLLEFARNDHMKEFGVPVLAIAFVTTKGNQRLRNLLSWTEQALRDGGEASFAQFFRFAKIDEDAPAGIDPAYLFFSPVWYVPFSRELVSLV